MAELEQKAEKPAVSEVPQQVMERIASDIERIARLHPMGEERERRASQERSAAVEELLKLGYSTKVVAPGFNMRELDKFFSDVVRLDLGVAKAFKVLDERRLAERDKMFAAAMVLLREDLPLEIARDEEKFVEFAHAKSLSLVSSKENFVIVGLDEAGSPAAAAALSYLPKSNALLVENLAVPKIVKVAGLDALLLKSAADIANRRATELGYVGIEVVVAEAPLPSPALEREENGRRLDRMSSLVANGLGPVQGFEYERETLSTEELAKREIRTARGLVEELERAGAKAEAEKLAAAVLRAETAEAEVPAEEEVGRRVPVMICIRPVMAAKEITPRKVAAIVRDISARRGTSAPLKKILEKVKKKAVLRIMLMDVRKLTGLWKKLIG